MILEFDVALLRSVVNGDGYVAAAFVPGDGYVAAAFVPGDGLTYQASDPFIEFIDSLSHGGPLLPPWHEWWGDEVMARLIPDADLRREILADTPRVPRSFYEDPVPLPTGWMTRHGCCFLQLSPAYDDDWARAVAYGWPTARMAGQHLDVVVKPIAVGESLMNLIERARPD